MAVNEDPVCRHGRPECECLDDTIPGADLGNLRLITSNVTNGIGGGCSVYEIGNYGVGLGAGTSAPIVTPHTVYPQGNPTFQFTPTVVEKCPDGHVVSDEIREAPDGGLTSTCTGCGSTVVLPRIPGGVSFERAGNLVGRAMTLDAEDDEEKVGELLADLTLLDRDVKREIARYKRTMTLIAIARNLVKKRALDDAAPVVG